MMIMRLWFTIAYVRYIAICKTEFCRSFIEDSWHGGIGSQSFDPLAGSIMNMFDFNATHPAAQKLLVDPSAGIQNTTS